MSRERLRSEKEAIERCNMVARAISADPRRQLVASLLNHPPDASIPLPESALNPIVPADPETLRLELVHCHLPMLEEMEFVEWDTDPLVVSRGSRFDEVSVLFVALRSSTIETPDSLGIGYQRLENEQRMHSDGS